MVTMDNLCSESSQFSETKVPREKYIRTTGIRAQTDAGTIKFRKGLGETCSLRASRRKIIIMSVSGLALLLLVIVPTVCLSAKGQDESKPKPLRVGAFNVKQFGKKKICSYNTAHALKEILQRYDIIVIQEVTDVSQTSIDNFLRILQTVNEHWTYIASERLGRGVYKEQYVFYYKSDSVTVEGRYQVPDNEDIFEREPFAIKIRYKSIIKETDQLTVLAGIHVKPSDVYSELTALPSAIKNITNFFTDVKGFVIMGDFNADCSYLKDSEKKTLSIFHSDAYRNLIPHTADTTVSSNTDCAYDRILIYGSDVDARKGQVYRFEEFLNLNMTEALKISDHYPVEFLLY